MRRFFAWLAIGKPLHLVFLVACSVYILAGVSLVPFHADESTQILMSRDYAYQFLQGDLARIYYDPAAPLTNETQLRLINGTLAKYLIGFAWHVAGYTIDDLNTDWDWGGDWDYNVAAGHLPSDGLLDASRLPSAVLTAAGAWIVFAIGWQLGRRWAATLATLYYTFSPGLLLNGRRAMMEGALTFFSLLVVLMAIWMLRRKSWAAALVLGVAAGLTVASKHTGAAVVASVFVACAIGFLVMALQDMLQRHEYGTALRLFGQHVLKLIAAGLLALGVFFVLNPAWWGADIGRLIPTILDWRQELLNGQAHDHNGYAEPLANAMGFARQVFIAQPQYFEVRSWSEIQPMTDQIAAYEASPWSGIALGGSPLGAGIVLLLVGIGIYALVRDPDIDLAARLPVGLWALTMAVVAFISPVEWQRYYLPVYPAIGLLAALALAAAVKWIPRRLEQSSEPSTSVL